MNMWILFLAWIVVLFVDLCVMKFPGIRCHSKIRRSKYSFVGFLFADMFFYWIHTKRYSRQTLERIRDNLFKIGFDITIHILCSLFRSLYLWTALNPWILLIHPSSSGYCRTQGTCDVSVLHTSMDTLIYAPFLQHAVTSLNWIVDTQSSTIFPILVLPNVWK